MHRSIVTLGPVSPSQSSFVHIVKENIAIHNLAHLFETTRPAAKEERGKILSTGAKICFGKGRTAVP